MNRRAIVVYFVLLALVILVSLYIFYNKPDSGSRSGSTTTTISQGTSTESFETTTYSNSTLTCAAASQYSCGAPAFLYPSTLVVNFTQQTGATWQSATIFFMNASEVLNLQQYSTYASKGTKIYNVASGVIDAATLNITSAHLNFSEPYGQIWAQYQIAGGTSTYYGKIGTVQ